MDSRTMEKQAEPVPAKQRVNKAYFHLTERTRKQAEVKACREAWNTCPHHLWMDVLRALDVRTYRRLSRTFERAAKEAYKIVVTSGARFQLVTVQMCATSDNNLVPFVCRPPIYLFSPCKTSCSSSRVSRHWQSNLAHVPRLNKGIFYLDLASLSAFLRFKQFFPNSSQSFASVSGSEMLLPPATCQISTPCSSTCYLRRWPRNWSRSKDGKKARHIADYKWWAQVFGVSSLRSVKKVRYRTHPVGARLLNIWFGVKWTMYSHTLWRGRRRQMSIESCGFKF